MNDDAQAQRAAFVYLEGHGLERMERERERKANSVSTPESNRASKRLFW